MLTKMERFQQWRGSKAIAELHLLNLALLISEYVNSVDNLDVIKATAETKHKEFDKDGLRGPGTLIFGKLFVEEAIVQLSDEADKEKSILVHLSSVLSSLYDNPQYDTKKNILALIEDVDQLLLLDEIRFMDKKSYRAFIFSSYMLFQIIKLSLEQLDWKSQLLVGVIINIEEAKEKVTQFLQKIEERSIKLGALTLDPAHVEPELLKDDGLQAAKNLLNQRYCRILSGSPLNIEKTKEPKALSASKLHVRMGKGHDMDKVKPVKHSIIMTLSELETDIAKVSSGINNLLELRKKKSEIEKKITIMQTLLSAIEANDQRISGRMYIQDFIDSHADSYRTLLDNSEEKLKESFIQKMEQLKASLASPDLSTGVIHGISWVTTPLTLVYRTATPQAVQNIVSTNFLPSTMDGACKAELKELAKASLANLHEKLKKKEQQITVVTNRFFRRDEELKKLLLTENSERLALLVKANDAMHDAMQASSSLLVTVKENVHFLNDLKEKSNVLAEFIRIHNTIFVKITNFLARFFSIFKTSTAKMIDNAGALKNQVDMLATEYQNAVDQEMLRIEHDPNVDMNIKSHLKKRFIAEETEAAKEKLDRYSPNKHSVRLLMNNLSQLFASNPHPKLGNKNVEEDEHEDEAVLVYS
jgi:hypothetical protein